MARPDRRDRPARRRGGPPPPTRGGAGGSEGGGAGPRVPRSRARGRRGGYPALAERGAARGAGPGRLRQGGGEPARPGGDVRPRQRAPPGQHGSEGTDPRLHLLPAERTAARVVLVLLRVVVDPPHR